MDNEFTQLRNATNVGTAAAMALACFLTVLIFLAHQRLDSSSRWSSARNVITGLSFIVAWGFAILTGLITMSWFGSLARAQEAPEGQFLMMPNVFIEPAFAWRLVPAATMLLTWLTLRLVVSARRRA
jgi:hypothetical protein